jgi:hypothetical protein
MSDMSTDTKRSRPKSRIATAGVAPSGHATVYGKPQMEQVKEDAIFNIVASLRDNVRNLPPERYDEIFADFEGAVKSKDIGYLADTVVNWALGGHGYDYAGAVVNRDKPVIGPEADETTKEIWNEFWSKVDAE